MVRQLITNEISVIMSFVTNQIKIKSKWKYLTCDQKLARTTFFIYSPYNSGIKMIKKYCS